jgi:RecJ-like exonuclease
MRLCSPQPHAAPCVDGKDKEVVMTRNNPEKKVELSRLQASDAQLNPGDEAARGTPGTGEDICPECQGSGRINRQPCPNCGGRGTIIRGIGGA